VTDFLVNARVKVDRKDVRDFFREFDRQAGQIGGGGNQSRSAAAQVRRDLEGLVKLAEHYNNLITKGTKLPRQASSVLLETELRGQAVKGAIGSSGLPLKQRAALEAKADAAIAAAREARVRAEREGALAAQDDANARRIRARRERNAAVSEFHRYSRLSADPIGRVDAQQLSRINQNFNSPRTAFHTPSSLEASATRQYARQRRILEERIAVASLMLNEDIKQLKFEKDYSDLKRQQIAIEQRVRESYRQDPVLGGGPTTRFQRAYAKFGGYGFGDMDPQNAPTLGRFLKQRTFQTAGYAASGALLYGGTQAITTLVKDAEELQAQLNILESQYAALDQTAELPKARAAIFEISRETGIATDQSAALAVQFSGAFRDASGTATDVAFEAQRIASEIAVIAELEPSQVFDDLIASARAFNREGTPEGQLEALRELGDLTLQARNYSGVPAKELLDFLGRVGPIARTASLELSELNAIGASLLQGSGVGGAALGEQLGRILTDFGSTSSTLIEVIQGSPDFQRALEDVDATMVALAEGDASVLFDILRAYKEFASVEPSKAADFIASVGGRREGPTLATLFQNADTALNIRDAGPADGTREREFAKKQETLRQQFRQLTASVEQLGLALFEAGIADLFEAIMVAADGVVDILHLLVGAFEAFNEVTFGLGPELLLAAAGVKAFAAAMAAVQAFQARGAAAGQIPGQLALDLGTGGKGGLLGTLFGRGRGLGAVAKSGPGLAVAGVAVLEVKAALDNERKEGAAQVNELSQLVRQRYDDGASVDELRNILGNISSDSNKTKLGNAIRGTKSAAQVVEDEIQKIESELASGQIAAILELTDEQLVKLLEGNTELLNRVAGSSGRGQKASDAEIAAFVREGVAGFRDNPTDDSFAAFGGDIVNLFNSSKDDAIKAVADSLKADAETKRDLEESIRRTSSEDAVKDFNTAVELFQQNEISYRELDVILQARLAELRQQLEIFRGRDDEETARVLKEIAAVEGLNIEAISARMSEAFGLSSLLSGLSGGSDSDPDRLLSELQILTRAGASPADKQSKIEAIIEAEKSAFEAYVDSAETTEEALRRFDLGFEIPDEVRQGLAQIIVESGAVSDAITQTAQLISGDVDALESQVTLALLGFTGAAEDIMAKIDAARRRMEIKLGALGSDRRLYAMGGKDDAWKKLHDEAAGNLDEFNLNADILTGLLENGVPETGRGSDEERAAIARRQEEDRVREAEEARREALAAELAVLETHAARAGDDAVYLAHIAQRKAEVTYRYAQTASERQAALAEMARADAAMTEALVARNVLLRDLVVAQNGDGAVSSARRAQADAAEAVAKAHGVDAQLRAEAEKIRADRSVQEALHSVFEAQIELLTAAADFKGDDVAAAKLQLKLVEQEIANLANSGLIGQDLQAEKDRLEAKRLSAMAAVRNATISTERDLISYNLEMGKITIGQAVAGLQALLAVAGDNEDLVRELNLEIKRMRDQAGQDLQFNLPTNLALPTAYEVRRLGQSEAAGMGYNDNRQINVTVNAETNADPQQIADAVASAVGDPSRSGTLPRRY
jgi:TP901 family phage tail tape measure protein